MLKYSQGKHPNSRNGFQKGYHSLSEFEKGTIPWNKGLTKETDERVKKSAEKLKDRTLSQSHVEKIKHVMTGKIDEESRNWKGDNAKKLAMHGWVVRKKGKASAHTCVDCGKQALDRSNKDHSYKRILENYSPTCKKCHMKYDKKYN